MALCDLCQGIRVNNLVPYCPPGQEDEPFKVGYEHQPSYRALETSSQNCPLCKLFLHALEEGGAAVDRMPEEIRDKGESRIWLIGGQEMFFDLNEPLRLSQINVQAGNSWRHTVLGLYTAEDDPAAISGDVVGRETSTDPASDRNFLLAARWIRDCVTQHAECSYGINPAVSRMPESELTPLPTRLIDVGAADGSKQPFLCHTGGAMGRYVSLSYCWGSAVALTTEKKTYSTRCQGIEFSATPKTIRDAITITRKLGLQYLWVDALCIIQDDDDDWQREAAQMGLVYRNSLFTISATGASDTSMGCFFQYASTPVQPVRLDYRSRDDKKKGQMFIRPQPATVTESLDSSPVNSRGWCLQERILSRRILHYTKDQLYWECQKHCIAEDGTIYDYIFRLKQSFDLRNYSGSDTNRISIFWRWCLVAVEYSKRKLTKASDKLPAMSGLASEVSRRTGDQYLAGLWRSHLHVGLLWEATPGKMVRHLAFRAPSWSWASLDGPIRYEGLISTSVPNIDVSDAHVTTTGGAHGGVSAGYIQLSGQIKHATRLDKRIHRPIDGWGSSEPWGYDVTDGNSSHIGHVVFDEADAIVPKDLLCLRVSDIPKRSGVVYNVLILESTGYNPEEHRRLGRGEISQTGWFDGCSRTAVTIV